MSLETHRITQNLDPNDGSGNNEELLQAGAVLENRYRIEGVQGAGGMSTVYQGRDLRFTAQKLVAVKEMTNRAKDDFIRDTIIATFEREANILATLNHPSIPKIHDYFTIGARSYLVMDFIHGNNLETILAQSQSFLPESQVITWAIELCDVLHYLHTQTPQPIIFRDMKPANIVVTPENKLILVDFGIAKHFQAGQKGTMIGTEGYSPPEQYRGDATPQVDIYALGATLHHILTRKDPRIETPFTFSERPIRSINPKISLELETVIHTAVQYNEIDRFPDAASMKKALLIVAQKTGGLSMPGKTANILTSQNIEPLWTFECEDEIRSTPTYHQGVVYIGSYDHNLYALNAASGEFLWKYPSDAGIVSKPAIYENNIFFGSEDQRVHAISAHTGQTIWSYYTDGPIRSSPTVAERHIFIGSDDHHLHIINALTGRRATKIDLGSPIRSTPLVERDQIFVGTENGEFFCVNFKGQIKWRNRSKRAVTSSPNILDDVIIFGSVDGIVYAFDAKTGWSIWRFRMDRGTISSPFIESEKVYIGSADGHVYCIESRSSKEIWRFKTDNQVSSSPIVIKDSVYFGGIDQNFYCLDKKAGRVRWQFKTGGAIIGSAISYDDIIYVGSTDNKVYALPT